MAIFFGHVELCFRYVALCFGNVVLCFVHVALCLGHVCVMYICRWAAIRWLFRESLPPPHHSHTHTPNQNRKFIGKYSATLPCFTFSTGLSCFQLPQMFSNLPPAVAPVQECQCPYKGQFITFSASARIHSLLPVSMPGYIHSSQCT